MRIDGATMDDLQIFRDADGAGGLIALFEPTETRVGRVSLRRRLTSPLSDPATVRETQAAVRFFAERWEAPLLPRERVDAVQTYLDSTIDLGEDDRLARDLLHTVWLPIREPGLCRELRKGVEDCAELLLAARSLAQVLLDTDPPPMIRRLCLRIEKSCGAIGEARRSLSLLSTIRTDRTLRGHSAEQVGELVGCLAELDALRTMGATTRSNGWTFPEIVDGPRFRFDSDGLWHPFLDAPTANPVRISGRAPVVFLTGPNMAGKSTFMRAVGLATLLAQVGMGVPARSLTLTPVEVLLTGLNPTENLREGLSFFFAEVLRVRQAAEQLASGARCLVLFDEVFKGTNVKDALEASLAVIAAFARSRRSGCIFSSHLVELAEPLAEVDGIQFLHFDGAVVDGRARYSYRLRPGVCDRRLGLQLMREAEVPELLARIGTG